MQIEGPDRYKLTYSPTEFTVLCSRGTDRFSGMANSPQPKLYVASIEEKPIYVGWTKQKIRDRLRFGWNAVGAGGYHGYAWRHQGETANLDIWCHTDAPD